MHTPADKNIAGLVKRCHIEAKRLNASIRPSAAGALLEEAATNLRLLAMKIERLEGDEWQPIKTAPKDGSAILLGYFRENFDGSVYEEGREPIVARWIEKIGGPSGWVARRERLNSDGPFSPSHWMSRPTPPEEVTS